MEENRPVYDWKTQLEELKKMLKAENERHSVAVKGIEEQAKVVIDLAGKDAKEAYKEWYDKAAGIWFQIKEFLNWSEYWAYYVFGGLILFGLILHYVFGV